jgi:predicted molibdopterin-dependent oxidoreductase YjgC
MINLKMNGLEISVEKGTTLLEAAQFYGFPVPTLCHMEGLSSYGACRLCVVEIGEGPKTKLVTSCTYLAEEGLPVKMDWVEFVLIAGIAFHISFIATIYPSNRASRLRPAEGLRYD